MSVVPLDPGAALARLTPTHFGWKIDARGPYGARRYEFASSGEAAEFFIMLRDEGGWKLRFGPGTDEVQALVEEIHGGDAQ